MTWLAALWSDLKYLVRRLDGLAAAYSGKDARAHQIDVALDTRDVYDHCTTCGCPQGCKALHRYPCDCDSGRTTALESLLVLAVLAALFLGLLAAAAWGQHARCRRLQGDPRAAFYGCSSAPASLREGEARSLAGQARVQEAAPEATGRLVVPRRPVAARATRSRAPLPSVLQRIKQCESRGDYRAENPTSTASGAWQITDPTWNHWRGYHHASHAPAVVQDAKALALYLDRGTQPWNASRRCWS